MLKNERKNRRKAFVLTALFHLTLFGAIAVYSYGESLAPYLPETIQEWLPASDSDAPAEKSTKKPQAWGLDFWNQKILVAK